MAFGITREELNEWKAAVLRGEIAFLTHYWLDPRFPGMQTVTKAGCADMDKLRSWCLASGLDPKYIHQRSHYPHYDLFGQLQARVLKREGLSSHLERFNIQ
ncbi:hypothetical protein ACFQZE_01680 [Paenibacillus sp. GCM10027627]|uniref:hypothetical protein n=1 Tax=unclassified Paenibacillus TaxID=185978 RepID=UPI003643BF15